MSQRRFVALVLALAATSAACGSSDSSPDGATSATVDGAAVAVGAAPLPGGVGSLGDAMEVAAAAPDQASDAACTIDLQSLENAVEAYELLNGALPTSQQALLDAQLIREPSVRFDVGPDGAVTASPGGPCT